MNKEKILLESMNKFGNFLSVDGEFNAEELETIYDAMEDYANQRIDKLIKDTMINQAGTDNY